jgi:hypothetical protein
MLVKSGSFTASRLIKALKSTGRRRFARQAVASLRDCSLPSASNIRLENLLSDDTRSCKHRQQNCIRQSQTLFHGDLPSGSAVFGRAICNCLIDVHYDRRHRHASGKGERRGHSYEYLCHAHPRTSLSKRHHAEYSDVVLKGGYLLEFGSRGSLTPFILPSLTASGPVTLKPRHTNILLQLKLRRPSPQKRTPRPSTQ